MDVKKWLIDWFVRNTDVSEEELLRHETDNYFERGYIDSFVFITLIGDIEEELGITLNNDQFEDRSFSTIAGMSRILKEALSK